MLAYAPASVPSVVAVVQEVQTGARDPGAPAMPSTDSRTEVRQDLRVGSTRYRFSKAVRIACSWGPRQWVCWAEELGPAYTGAGRTAPEAQREWGKLIHADFQLLHRKRPFEMDESERNRWSLLASVVDILDYRRTTPIATREIGCVRYARLPYPSRIIWIDGRRDTFSLDQVPAELAGCKPGQCIEAVVERDPASGRLLRIAHIQRISTIHRPTPAAMDQYWKNLPVADLPETDWDR